MTKRKQDSKQLSGRALLKQNIPSLLIIYSLSDSHNKAFFLTCRYAARLLVSIKCHHLPRHLCNVSSLILYAKKFLFYSKTFKCNLFKSKSERDKVKQGWWRGSFGDAGERMYFLMLLKRDMSKLIMLRKPQRQQKPIPTTPFYPLSPHAKKDGDLSNNTWDS